MDTARAAFAGARAGAGAGQELVTYSSKPSKGDTVRRKAGNAPSKPAADDDTGGLSDKELLGLCIVGYSCTVFDAPQLAARIEAGQGLVEWQLAGRGSASSSSSSESAPLHIDRFDVRGMLHSIAEAKPAKTSSEGFQMPSASRLTGSHEDFQRSMDVEGDVFLQSDPRQLSSLNDLRWRDLRKAEEEETMRSMTTEERIAQLRAHYMQQFLQGPGHAAAEEAEEAQRAAREREGRAAGGASAGEMQGESVEASLPPPPLPPPLPPLPSEEGDTATAAGTAEAPFDTFIPPLPKQEGEEEGGQLAPGVQPPLPAESSTGEATAAAAGPAASGEAPPPPPHCKLLYYSYVKLPLPPNLCTPKDLSQHRVIEATAKRVAASPQLEMLLRMKQASSNAAFRFLFHGDPLHEFFRVLVRRAQSGQGSAAAGAGAPTASSAAGPGDSEEVDWPAPKVCSHSLERGMCRAEEREMLGISDAEEEEEHEEESTGPQQKEEKEEKEEGGHAAKMVEKKEGESREGEAARVHAAPADTAPSAAPSDTAPPASADTAPPAAAAAYSSSSASPPPAAASAVDAPPAASLKPLTSLGKRLLGGYSSSSEEDSDSDDTASSRGKENGKAPKPAAASSAAKAPPAAAVSVPASPPVPPAAMQEVMTKLLSYASKPENGLSFIEHVRKKEAGNPQFSFLQAFSPFHTFFQQKLAAIAKLHALQQLEERLKELKQRTSASSSASSDSSSRSSNSNSIAAGAAASEEVAQGQQQQEQQAMLLEEVVLVSKPAMKKEDAEAAAAREREEAAEKEQGSGGWQAVQDSEFASSSDTLPVTHHLLKPVTLIPHKEGAAKLEEEKQGMEEELQESKEAAGSVTAADATASREVTEVEAAQSQSETGTASEEEVHSSTFSNEAMPEDSTSAVKKQRGLTGAPVTDSLSSDVRVSVPSDNRMSSSSEMPPQESKKSRHGKRPGMHQQRGEEGKGKGKGERKGVQFISSWGGEESSSGSSSGSDSDSDSGSSSGGSSNEGGGAVLQRKRERSGRRREASGQHRHRGATASAPPSSFPHPTFASFPSADASEYAYDSDELIDSEEGLQSNY